MDQADLENRQKSRTLRDSAGQIQEVDGPFERPLGPIMYPGDEGADDPVDVWNYRPSLIYAHPECLSQLARRDAETGEITGDTA